VWLILVRITEKNRVATESVAPLSISVHNKPFFFLRADPARKLNDERCSFSLSPTFGFDRPAVKFHYVTRNRFSSTVEEVALHSLAFANSVDWNAACSRKGLMRVESNADL
jgi:hypothetical protein